MHGLTSVVSLNGVMTLAINFKTTLAAAQGHNIII